jgi:hypothetical protein
VKQIRRDTLLQPASKCSECSWKNLSGWNEFLLLRTCHSIFRTDWRQWRLLKHWKSVPSLYSRLPQKDFSLAKICMIWYTHGMIFCNLLQWYLSFTVKPSLTLSHHLLNILLQIANKLVLKKKTFKLKVCYRYFKFMLYKLNSEFRWFKFRIQMKVSL